MQPGFARQRRRVVQALCASAVSAACGPFTRGPLEEPPAWFDSGRARPPVVFVHGAFGARLRQQTTGREIWPIGMADLLVSSFDQLALPLDSDTGDAAEDGIVAYELFDEAGAVEFYGSLVTMLTSAGGYQHEVAGTPVRAGPPRLYAYLYDWRRDLSRAASGLDALIEQIRADHGEPGLKVDLVAHSSGGLLARYFLLHGATTLGEARVPEPNFAGSGKAARVVAIGVPELGIARAVAALIEGEPVVLSRVHPEVLVTSYTTFQLLPHGDDTWLLDARGRPIVGDSCDIDLWREYRMSIFDPSLRARVRGAAPGRKAGQERVAMLERGFGHRLVQARRFREAIRAAPVPALVPYFSIGGDCRPTQARLLVESNAGSLHARTRPEDVRWRSPALDYSALMLEDGDGTVTRSSASSRPGWPTGDHAPPVPAENWPRQDFVCASHNQLVVNIDCQRALLRALSVEAAPGGAAAGASTRLP